MGRGQRRREQSEVEEMLECVDRLRSVVIVESHDEMDEMSAYELVMKRAEIRSLWWRSRRTGHPHDQTMKKYY